MGSDNSSPKNARIESLWAKGRTARQIAHETGSNLEYVQRIIRLILAHSHTIRPPFAANDDDKHLTLIRKKHGVGFPYYARVPV